VTAFAAPAFGVANEAGSTSQGENRSASKLQKPLITIGLFGTVCPIIPERRINMKQSLFAIIGVAFSILVFSATGARSGNYPFGDEPYRLNWDYDADVQSGCLKWNWQQYGWDDYCPVYVRPKAYMYPRSSRTVLRTRG
jgi:hypothetical protein